MYCKIICQNIFFPPLFILHCSINIISMKKIFLSFLLILVSFIVVNAQQDSLLQKYTGKYKFPEGSIVSEINVTIENGILNATSAMGATELRKTDTENVFEIVVYGGFATFKKDTVGKIATLQVLVGDINIEGTKSDGVSIASMFKYIVNPMHKESTLYKSTIAPIKG